MKKTRMAVILGAILIFAALAGTLAAQAAGVGIFRIERNIPGQVIVVDIVDLPPETVGVYADGECTTPLTLVDWGEMIKTSPEVTKFFLQNEGSDPFAVKSVDLKGWAGGWGWRAFVSRAGIESTIGSGAINPGEVVRMEVTLYPWDSTPAGEYAFVVIVRAGTPTTVPTVPVG